MSDDISIRIGQAEIGRIINLKENLDHNEVVRDHVTRYQKLGWVLAGVKVQGGAALDLDFSLSPDSWSRQFTALSMEGVQVNLGVRTGKPSKLLVLEVNKGEGALSLEQLGEWRAACVAAVGDSREQHYYKLPPESPVPPSFFLAPQVLIYGEGGLVLLPPSLEPEAHEPWRWLQPPWDSPPQEPTPAVWQFLKQHIPALLADPGLPGWTEIYRTVSPYGLILRALLVPAGSSESYYRGILREALAVGLRDPEFLLGLLWHAPHGEARHQPERLDDLRHLVAAALEPVPVVPGTDPLLPQPVGAGGVANFFQIESVAVAPRKGRAVARAPKKAGPAAPAKFDQSVSGQFFQLLAGLGEKVISESCRYEAALSGLGDQAEELESLLAQWQHSAASPMGQPSDAHPGGGAGEPGPIEFEWASVINQQAQQKQQLLEFQAAANDFLAQNPDLAADRDKIRLVLFCLRNYISINPECARLPFREKLEMAGKMARGF